MNEKSFVLLSLIKKKTNLKRRERKCIHKNNKRTQKERAESEFGKAKKPREYIFLLSEMPSLKFHNERN